MPFDEAAWDDRMAEVRALTEPDGPFAMEPVTVRGVEMRNYRRRARSLVEVLRASAERFAEREAVVDGERRVRFGELAERAEGVAGGLQAAGVEPGDRVGILGANSLEWMEAFWGCVLAGAVSVPLNAWWTADELSYAVDHADLGLLFADRQRAPLVEGAFPADRTVELAPGLEGLPSGAFGAVEPDEGDPVSIFYTSGTTGRPKGAVVDHRGVVVNLRNLVYLTVRARILAGEPRPQGNAPNVALLVVPLFHVTGCHAVAVASYAFGNRVVLYPRRSFDPEVAMELIERERVTHFSAVPTLVLRILDSEAFGGYDLSSLRSVTYGGAPVPPELPRRTEEALPSVRSQGNGYGLTETNAVVVANWGPEYLRKPHAIGRPVPVADVAILDPEGRPVPEGELAVKGPMLMAGYWRDPEATAEAIREGWFHTGDIVRRDPDGDLILVDRSKDVVIRGGENVYSVEVENVLVEHPSVVEAAVLGVPHPELGEEVKAVVVVRDRVEAEELAGWCRERLAYFKVPAHWELRTEPLPRNPAGKVLKPLLRSEP